MFGVEVPAAELIRENKQRRVRRARKQPRE